MNHLQIIQQINQICLSANNLDEMLSSVLEEILSIFDCDRAWLLYLGDPASSTWPVAKEHTRPEWPSAFATGIEFPVDADLEESLKQAIKSSKAIIFNVGSERSLPDWVAERFSIQAQMAIAIYPRSDQPWLLGIHHCAAAHTFSEQEQEIFSVVAQCITGPLRNLNTLQELHDSERYNRMLFEKSPMGLALCHMNGDLIDVNPAFAAIIGRTVEETLSLSYWEITPEKYAEDEARQLESLENSGQYGPYEKEYIHKTGHLVPVRLLGVIIEREGERCIWSSVEDITERTSIELELKQRQAMFQSVIEASPVPYALNDDQQNIIFLNAAFVDTFGYTLEDIPTLEDWWPKAYPEPEYRQWVATTWQAHLENAKHEKAAFDPLEINIQCKDGTLRTVMVSAASLEESFEGTHLVILYDITERKKMEEELRLSSLVLQNSSEGMLVTDANDHIIAINPAFSRITGYSFEEVKGENPSMFSSGRHDQAFYQAMRHELNTLGQWQGEIWDRRKNGEIFAKWLTINTIYSDDGSVHRHVALFSDITEKKHSEELIWRQANFDTLTGLANRNMFHDQLTQEVMKANRAKLSLALLLIDLDQFKEVNDTLGHDVGDILLLETAHRIRSCVRESDTVARLGGDEFTIILSELSDNTHIEDVAQKIISKLAEPYQLGSEVVYVSASIGITLCPNDTTDADALIKNADQAMYLAKQQGRNRFTYFTQSLQDAAQIRLRITSDLRQALEQEELLLHYQPQINTETGRVTGVEALVRWQHPDKGLMPPASFIPIAEETGLILPLGEWAMHTACSQLKQWFDQGIIDIRMSVNLSARQFRQATLSTMVSTLIEKTGIDPYALELEITESTAMDNPVENANTMAILRSIGVNLAIDDFGTGHSSLDYLKKFPVHRLKLDRSFIMDIETAPNDVIIVSATTDLAHNLGMDVVAEGVETEKQVEYLTRLNCDTIQGYYYSKPLPAKQAEEFIRERNSSPNSLDNQRVSATDVLIIDDDDWICQYLETIFEQMGHKPATETDPVKGLERVRENPDLFQMILVDMLMPNMSGIDLVKAIRKFSWETPIAVITAYKPDAVRKTFKALEKECNLIQGINYFIIEKPLSEGVIRQITQKLFQAHFR